MIHAVIMAGGKGTRFWPLSRSVKAKQYLNIVGNKSLLAQTIDNLQPFIAKENIWIVSNQAQLPYLEEYKNYIPGDQILLEPVGKNTAPCIGWAAIEIQKKDPDATMIMLPADHFIENIPEYQKTLQIAVDTAQTKNNLVTIGVQPKFAHTGYGYIEVTEKSDAVLQVKAFHEKPNKKIAESYIETGKFFWNSGLFIWRANKILGLIEAFLPHNFEVLQKIAKIDTSNDSNRNELTRLFNEFESISIDYGIMEKSSNETCLVPATFSWSDIGNWIALDDFWQKDEQGNARKGQLIALDSKNNIVHSNKKLVTLVDVNDLIVVESDDALLILPKSSDQKIKDLYNELPEQYK